MGISEFNQIQSQAKVPAGLLAKRNSNKQDEKR